MFHIMHIDHIVLRVKNIELAQQFYRDVLGCRLERVEADLGLFQFRAGAQLIDLITVDGPLGRASGNSPDIRAPNLAHFCLRITPYHPEQLTRYFSDLGITVSSDAVRYGADGFGHSVYIQDPDGNVIELKGPPLNQVPSTATE